MAFEFYLGGSGLCQDVFHFFRCVCLTDRCRGIVAGETAAIKRVSGVDEREVYRMTDQVVDNYRDAAGAQCFFGELLQVLGGEMMSKEAAADQVKAAVPERQGQRVGHDRIFRISEMRQGAIEQCDLQVDAAAAQAGADSFGNFTGAGGYFQ